MQKIYVIGASGLIGDALYKNLKSKNYNVIGSYAKNIEPELLEFDLCNPDFSIFKNISQNDIIYFMTAYSNPNWISENKDETKLLNYTKTIEFINFFKKIQPRFIFMSSVEIFDGNKGNYKEDDVANPLNYYGLLKSDIENYLINNYPNHCIVRTGWNVGLNEKSRCVIQLTYETLLKPNAKMATDNFFSLAYVKDTAEGLARIPQNIKLKKIHLCSSQILCRQELADKIIKYSKKRENMQYSECIFSEIPYKEPRGRINDLINTLSINELKMKYEEVDSIIRKKVDYLDRKYDK